MNITKKTDYYSILKIDENATYDDIFKAFNKLSVECKDENMKKIINEAYQVLSVPYKRFAYNCERSSKLDF